MTSDSTSNTTEERDWDNWDVVKKEAHRLFVHEGLNRAQICKEKHMPSRPTLNKWIKEGTYENGVNWEAARLQRQSLDKKIKNEGIYAKDADDTRDAMVKLKEFLADRLLPQMKYRVEEGLFDMSIKDFGTVAELLMKLNDTGSDKLEFAQWFVSEVLVIVYDVTPEQYHEMLQLRFQALEHATNARLDPKKKHPELKQLTA